MSARVAFVSVVVATRYLPRGRHAAWPGLAVTATPARARKTRDPGSRRLPPICLIVRGFRRGLPSLRPRQLKC